MENKGNIIRKERTFQERTLLPGEFAEVLDRHTLAFCFQDCEILYLNFDESVSEETAKEFIFRIKQFIEKSYKAGSNRGRV